ncbi:MAG: hypothetical protein IJT41_07145 [Clostridia bacterium]|nr:hypothetical protein [Clostridia bacterium]
MKTNKRLLSVLLSLMIVLGIGAAGLTAHAADTGETTVRVVNSDKEVTVGYKEKGYFEFEAANLPAGAAVHVFLNGEDRGESVYIYVSDPTEDYTVEAKVLGSDGGEIADSGEIRVHVKNGFADRLGAFFNRTFGTAADVIADVFGAIFMTILVFFNGGKFM